MATVEDNGWTIREPNETSWTFFGSEDSWAYEDEGDSRAYEDGGDSWKTNAFNKTGIFGGG